MDAHFTGDNHGECAKIQGLVGIVVYGGARDIAGYRRMAMTLYCTGSAPIDKPPNVQVTGYNVPIQIGGTTVRPGDVVIADEDGVVCIPDEILSAFTEKIKIIFEIEGGLETAIQRNVLAAEIREIIDRKKRA